MVAIQRVPRDEIERLAAANQRLLDAAGKLIALTREMTDADMQSRLSKEVQAILEASDAISRTVRAAAYVNA